MKTVSVKLSQVKVNEANPRTITDSKFQKLIDSLLAFPKMLEIRPIVVDSTMTALGGNMRYRALLSIAEMDAAALQERLTNLKDVKKKPQAERDALLNWWTAWQKRQEVGVVKASELSEDEQKQFIIKDNASFGQWDYDMLANEWDSAELEDWGVSLPVMDNMDIDSFFNGITDTEAKDKGDKITIFLSAELKDKKEDIAKLVKDVLSEYQGVSIE